MTLNIMSNKQIAAVLFEMADVLELKDPEDRFRFNAYRQAGQKISTLGEDINDIYREGGTKALNDIPGVGESIADAIEQLMKTGKFKELESLKKKVSLPQLEFSKIPSVGPKNARKLYELTGAKTIEGLARKLQGKKELGPFQEKTLQNVLRGIEIMQKSSGRILLGEALPQAEKIVNQLKESGMVQKIDAVGSLRRRVETVGDIDLVAASNNPPKAIEKFIDIVHGNVLVKGSAKCTIVNEDGEQTDLEILPASEYGSLLQHFTGSKEHNIAFRTYLQSQNLSFSEHGIKKLKSGKWPVKTPDIPHSVRLKLDGAKKGETIKCSTEEDVYHYSGMAWIAPELREDRGEIKAAIAHTLPSIIKLENIKGDLQMHSDQSDGSGSIEEMAKAGRKLGYSYIAITDHSRGLGIAHGLDAKRLQAQINEVDRWNKSHRDIKIIKSIEVNINADGSLDADEKMLKNLDFITASVHSSFSQSREKMTARILKAIGTGLIDNIGHPTGRMIDRREGVQADWEKIYEACVARHVALEINADPARLDLPDKMVFEARRYGVKFTISTDAHAPEQLNNINFGVSVARRGWLRAADVLNTYPLDKLLSWIKR